MAGRAGDTGPLYADGGGVEYFYPGAGDPPAPLGRKLCILTKGGVAVLGPWRDADSLGWAHLHSRNRVKENLIVDSTRPFRSGGADGPSSTPV